MGIEQELIDGVHQQKQVRSQLKRIRMLIALQHEERSLGEARVAELEKTVRELEARRGILKEKIIEHQRWIHSALRDIHRSLEEETRVQDFLQIDRIEAPRRKVLSHWVERSLGEIQAYKADFADSDQLESRIREEKEQLAYLFQDLKEQENVLELNRQLQVDLLERKHEERVGQLENYRKLKGAESEVEKMIQEFNARKELERAVETERLASRAMKQGEFTSLRGKLPLPLHGKIVSSFGRSFDPALNLHVFKKGIEILPASKRESVYAISAGKVAFSGEMPQFGRLTIIDHGGHYYSLCGHLGELKKQVGESVAAGDVIGTSDDAGAPIYFEIRVRNVAVNPLQWISN